MDRIQVGHIPSITWNRLKTNAAVIEKAPVLDVSVDTTFQKLPEGVSVKTMSPDDAEKWMKAHAPEEEPEKVVASKQPIYHPQAFATGLGEEYDTYMRGSLREVHLLEVKDGAQIETPVLWDQTFYSGNQAASAQIIHVGEGASLTLAMTCRSSRKAHGTAAVSTKVLLEKGAKLALAKVQLLGKGYTHFDDLGAALLDKASMQFISLELGAGNSYTGAQAELVGNASAFQAKVGYIAQDGTTDMNYNVVQRGRKTNCEMSFDGVLDHGAVKRLSDTIDFRRGSKGSYGHEKENVLLLADNIVNKSLPVILCEEEDMEGSHGATIGQLDQDMLFYLASRGIDEKAAQQLMVRARLGAVARELPEEKLREEVRDYIEEAFQA